MKNSNKIKSELSDISPTLAAMEKVNVFEVPEGYFEKLPVKIADFTILNENNSIENIGERYKPYVPEGYFDNLSNSILEKVRALNPAEDAEDEKQIFSDVLAALKGVNVFSEPARYFETLGENILAKVKSLELSEAGWEIFKISPTLAGLKSKNVFSVPYGYFELLHKQIQKSIETKPAGIIPLSRKMGWLKYAVAAVITGVIAFFSVELFNNHSPSDVNKINIAANSNLPDYIKESLKYKNEAEVDAGLAQLSDADIVKYLEKNGNVMDNELLMSNTDESEMPSEKDYLNDSSTLNNYLDKINGEQEKNAAP
jgi:hypothetical protein